MQELPHEQMFVWLSPWRSVEISGPPIEPSSLSTIFFMSWFEIRFDLRTSSVFSISLLSLEIPSCSSFTFSSSLQ